MNKDRPVRVCRDMQLKEGWDLQWKEVLALALLFLGLEIDLTILIIGVLYSPIISIQWFLYKMKFWFPIYWYSNCVDLDIHDFHGVTITCLLSSLRNSYLRMFSPVEMSPPLNFSLVLFNKDITL